MQEKGFTLIELLVVIAIIGMLSSVVLASLNNARGKARDVVRKQILVQVRTALENYYSANGSYPVSAGTWDNQSNWIPGLAPTYISKLPVDPLGGAATIPTCATNGYNRQFIYFSDGQILNYCHIVQQREP